MPPGHRPARVTALRSSGDVALIVLAMLAVAYTAVIARPFLLPMAFAWLVKLLLSPAVRRLKRLGLPTGLGAAVMMLALVLVVGWGAWQLSEPATEWARRMPEQIAAIQKKVRAGMQESPLESVNKASKAVSELTDGNAAPGEKPIEVAVVSRPPSAALLGWLQEFGLNLVFVLGLLYLLLAQDESLQRKFLGSLSGPEQREMARQALRQIETQVARYLATITLTNACLGVVVGTICWLWQLPNPALWGVVAALANFVPFIGSTVGIGLVAVVGVTTWPTLWQGIAPALVYAVVKSLEGWLVTPLILGRRLRLSPVVLFLWLLLIGWLWGVPGALVAVPLLATVKIAADHVPRLQLLAQWLGR